MSAYIFEGDVGSGKTYAATTMALWLAKQGRKVAHNWDIAWPADLRHLATRYDEPIEVMGMEDIDILMDEAQSSAGARDWEAMPKKFRNWLSHHRHFGNNLIFLTQHYKFVDVYIRRLAPKGVWSVWRFLNITGGTPMPSANPETGDRGLPNIWGSRLFLRPWKDLDHPNPIGPFLDLLALSRDVPGLYGTRDKSTVSETPSPPPASGSAPAKLPL